LTASAHEHRVGRLIELGRMPEAAADLEAMRKLADELRQPAQRWLSEVCGARLALLEGRLPEAEILIAAARTIGERTQGWNAAVAFRLQLYLLRREQGRIGEVEALLQESIVEYPTFPLWRCVQAQVAADLRHDAQALETLEDLVANDFAALPVDAMWLVSMGLLAEAASAIGHTQSAARLYARLLAYEGRVAVSYPEISTGAVARCLGLLAFTEQRWDAAETHFEHALELNGRIGARPWLVRTQRDYARMLAARRAAGDSAKARALLSKARATAKALGIPEVHVEASTPND
jgi:tetratricopeptide (TPR) repeat protein